MKPSCPCVEGASAEGIKKTKATLYKMIRSGNFPKPTYMGRSHVLWDIETFISPVLSMLRPGAAESILDYQSRNLSSAAAAGEVIRTMHV